MQSCQDVTFPSISRTPHSALTERVPGSQAKQFKVASDNSRESEVISRRRTPALPLLRLVATPWCSRHSESRFPFNRSGSLHPLRELTSLSALTIGPGFQLRRSLFRYCGRESRRGFERALNVAPLHLDTHHHLNQCNSRADILA